MTFSFLWFAAGLAVGLEVACLIAWWSLRRENRKAARRVNHPYDHLFQRDEWGGLEVVPYEVSPLPERPTGGGDIPSPLASRRADP